MTHSEPEDAPQDSEAVQLALEAESRAIGARRYQAKRRPPWEEAIAVGVDEAALPPGRRLLRRAIQPMTESIRTFVQEANQGRAGRRHTAAPFVAAAVPEAAAYLTLRCALQAGVQSLRLQRAALMIASALLGHLRGLQFAELNPGGAAGLQRALKGRRKISAKRRKAFEQIYESSGVDIDWPQQDRVQVGIKLLELAVDATGLFVIHLIEEGSGKRTRKRYEVRLSPSAHDWLERQHARCELLDPLPLPMVVEPRQWTSPTDGGYLDAPIGNSLVKTYNRPYLEELANVDLSPVYDAVNMVQNVRWQVNRDVLSALRTTWESGGRLAGLPPRDDEPLPAKPLSFDYDEAAQADWRRAASAVHRANEMRTSKRLAILQRLWVAEKFSRFPAIYFPHNIDWRGRVYPMPKACPNPQDNDVGRALIRFADGVPLGETGSRWLAIHLANLFGVDKVGFEERLAWVHDHEAMILDSAADPLDGSRFWTTAGDPWQALAACFEWAGFRRDGASFISHLPIALDGSNSGLQHFTALLRDTEAAPHVNLVAREKPGDLYRLVAERAQAVVDASTEPAAAPWRNGKIDRRIAKEPCMTYAYAVSPQGMAEQIADVLDEIDAANREKGNPPHLGSFDNREAAKYLAKLMRRIIEETVPAAGAAMKWLRTAASAFAAADLPLWWTTPSGLPVMQRYPKLSSRRVSVGWQGRTIELALEDEDKPDDLTAWLARGPGSIIDAYGSRQGIAPNFIHSLDAAHLMAVARQCAAEGIQSLAVIHDSFGTHAGNTDRLAGILRETFVSQYRVDRLAALHSDLLEQLNGSPQCKKLRPPPQLGALDIAGVLDATYMFA